ncbi:SDR family NAD(P)-dependent oxidoreductase [Nocardia sp. NPDC049526]|uniref:SDR family NAD(P)-dependent oxidoreductase n=1 Tax=Nocardia sp. NPDC049526 TaxID=3364316 RepID=UPI0037A5E2A5
MLGRQSRSSLVGKVAVITGGAKGVGAATAQRLIDKGAAVAIVDLPETVQPEEPRMITLSGDVTRLSDMTEAADKVLDHFGRIDIVIANAGVAARGATLRASSSGVVDRLLDVNIRGALNTVHACLPSVIDNSGHVVLLSSVFAYLNGVGTIPYAMSKAAIEQLGRGLRVELSAYDVSVTTAYFAMIDTDMIRRSVDADPAATALLDTLPRVLHKRITTEQAARAIVAGIARRNGRVVRPRRWAAVSSLRGVLGPAMDAHMSRHAGTQSIVRELDVRHGQDRLTT